MAHRDTCSGTRYYVNDHRTGEDHEVLPPLNSLFGPATSPLDWPRRPSPGPTLLPPPPGLVHPGIVRNMGNFNFSQTHVLTFFHHIEQVLLSFIPYPPHIPAMTSHVAYVIYAYSRSSRHKDSVTLHFLLMSFFFLCIWDRTFSYVHYLFPLFLYPCRLTHSVTGGRPPFTQWIH